MFYLRLYLYVFIFFGLQGLIPIRIVKRVSFSARTEGVYLLSGDVTMTTTALITAMKKTVVSNTTCPTNTAVLYIWSPLQRRHRASISIVNTVTRAGVGSFYNVMWIWSSYCHRWVDGNLTIIFIVKWLYEHIENNGLETDSVVDINNWLNWYLNWFRPFIMNTIWRVSQQMIN